MPFVEAPSYAIAHKEPTRNDFENMLAEKDPVTPQPERLNDLELGYQYQSAVFNAGVNLYYMDYDNQFVLTGAQDSNGEMVARNIKDSYRMGVELMAGIRPFEGFRWDVNATWSKNRAKNTTVTVINPDWTLSYANVGTTHLSYSPDLIVGSVLSYEYKGLRAALMSKYISEQYMTNSGYKEFLNTDGKTYTRAMLDAGLGIAVASDYNPGSTPSGDMKFIISLSCIKMRLMPAEAINAATINSAYAMGESSTFGSLDIGYTASFIITHPIPGIDFIPYAYTTPIIEKVYLRGKRYI